MEPNWKTGFKIALGALGIILAGVIAFCITCASTMK
jgi:hypothetical protein